MAPIYLVALVHTATHACFTGSKVVISLLALELGATQSVIGVLVAAYAIAPLLFGIYSGRLADRIGVPRREKRRRREPHRLHQE